MEEHDRTVKLNLLDLVLLVVKWRKLFIVNFIIAVIISVSVALLLPVWYTSTTVILPASGGSGSLPSFLPSDLAGVAANFGFELGGDEIYETILTSRTLKENIITRFNLREVYRMDDDAFPEDVLLAFGTHLTVTTLENQSIAISMEDQDPQRAADMANACIGELDAIYSAITSETASKNRQFIEKRLSSINDTIKVIQETLLAFQLETGALHISEQMIATLTSAAEIKALQLSNEVKLNVLSESFGPDHPIITQLNTANTLLLRQYNSILDGAESEVFIGLREYPELGQKYRNIYRDLIIQNKLLEFVYPQYENARIQEQRETSNVQILDVARVPNIKSRPPRRLIVMAAAVISFILTLMLILILNYWTELPVKNKDDWEKVNKIMRILNRS